jgi:hypothetical protein
LPWNDPTANECEKVNEKVLKSLKVMLKNLIINGHLGLLIHHFGLIRQNMSLNIVAGQNQLFAKERTQNSAAILELSFFLGRNLALSMKI